MDGDVQKILVINEIGGINVAKELLFSLTKKDFKIDTFRSGGKGGQYQNTTDSGVRITHIESGAVGESRTERSQSQNKKLALQRLVASDTFQKWQKIKSSQIMGLIKTPEQIEKELEDWMKDENLKIEME